MRGKSYHQGAGKARDHSEVQVKNGKASDSFQSFKVAINRKAKKDRLLACETVFKYRYGMNSRDEVQRREGEGRVIYMWEVRYERTCLTLAF